MVVRKRWTCGWVPSVTRLEAMRFPSVKVHGVILYHGLKSEARHQMLEAVNVAGLGIRRKLECIQWQLRLAQRLLASSFIVVVSNVCYNKRRNSNVVIMMQHKNNRGKMGQLICCAILACNLLVAGFERYRDTCPSKYVWSFYSTLHYSTVQYYHK